MGSDDYSDSEFGASAASDSSEQASDYSDFNENDEPAIKPKKVGPQTPVRRI